MYVAKLEVTNVYVAKLLSQAVMENKMAAQKQSREELAAISAALNGNEEELKAHKLEQKEYDGMIELMGTVHAVENQIAGNYSESGERNAQAHVVSNNNMSHFFCDLCVCLFLIIRVSNYF